MATTRISIKVDRKLLDEVRRRAGKDFKLSALVDEVLRGQIPRFRLLALLDEMDREAPISPEDQAKGERLWERIAAPDEGCSSSDSVS